MQRSKKMPFGNSRFRQNSGHAAARRGTPDAFAFHNPSCLWIVVQCAVGLACGVTQADDPEARRDIAGKLFLPAPLHLRLERHGLERFDSGHALD
jgi:hypothetical protein